jgi:hypothetical protein
MAWNRTETSFPVNNCKIDVDCLFNVPTLPIGQTLVGSRAYLGKTNAATMGTTGIIKNSPSPHPEDMAASNGLGFRKTEVQGRFVLPIRGGTPVNS